MTCSSRLSEAISHRLRANNPAIADLSDPDRASKIGEQLSELYDNEWTDAFEQIKAASKKLADLDIIVILMKLLKVSNGLNRSFWLHLSTLT